MAQRRAARWVTNIYSSYDSVSAMLGNLGWRPHPLKTVAMTRASRCFTKYSMALLQCRCLHILSGPRRSLATALITPLVSAMYMPADYFRFSFFPMTVVLWNRLPVDIIFLSDLDSFKREVCKINHLRP